MLPEPPESPPVLKIDCRSSLKEIIPWLRPRMRTWFQIKGELLARVSYNERRSTLKDINYSRVEGANIAHIKPARVLSFFSKAGTCSTCGTFKEERRGWPMDS